jgi:hypothetical protein
MKGEKMLTTDYPEFVVNHYREAVENDMQKQASAMEERLKKQAEWAEIERLEARRNRISQAAVDMAQWAREEYRRAKDENIKDMRVLTDLTLNWNPARVLTHHKDFKHLITALNDQETWDRLRDVDHGAANLIADAVRGRVKVSAV